MDRLYKENFISMIKSIIPTARPVSGRTEMVVRCPFCGDSDIKSHAHFYISVPQGPEDLSFYQCKRINCMAKGILNDETLRKLGCSNTNILVELSKHNADILKLPKYQTIKSINIYPLQNKYIRQDNNNQYKLNYLNQRIGANFTLQDVLELKIFLNLYDVLNTNRLPLTRKKFITDQMDLYFIGFISYDNSYCGLRKVVERELYESINKRYVNYELVKKIDEAKNYYVIPTRINILDPSPIRVHIAEGQIDILGVYYNINHCNRYQNIYIACGGKSYKQALEFIFNEFGLINYELHFYPDRDVNDNYFRRLILNTFLLLPTDIYIHRNIFEDEKDYGVPITKIKEDISIIWEAPL